MPSGDLSNWLFLAQRLFDDLVTLLRVPPTRFGHLVLPASLPAYLWPNNSHLSSVPNLVGHDIRYIFRLSSCRLTEGFIIPPCLTLRSKESNSAWPLRSIRITGLHRYYEPLRHPVAFQSLFRVHSYRAYLLPRIFLGAYRTSPVSIVSLLPCRRHYPAGVSYFFSQCAIAHAAFAVLSSARPPGLRP